MARANISSVDLIDAATTTGAKAPHHGGRFPLRSFQARGSTSAGAGAATIKAQVSNVPAPSVDADWIDLATFSLVLGTTATNDSAVVEAPWRWIRGNVTAISGTDATVNLYMGC